MKTMLTFAVCLTLTVLLNAQTTIFVKPDGTGNGTTWATACNFETAVKNAVSGNQIWVQKGTYYPSKMLIVPESVKIYGGFAGVETALSQRNFSANPTIIDAQNKFGSVFRLGKSSELNGLTIQNGNANGNPYKNGGGIWADDSVVVENCVIENNAAALDGGGIYASGKIKIVNSTIDENRATGSGANTFGNCTRIISQASIVMPPPIPGGAAPALTKQPGTTAQSRVQGVAFAALSVAVSGTAPFKYQWYAYENGNSTLVPDATEAFYTPPSELKDVQNDLAYFCVISNDYGTSVSNLSGLHTVTDEFLCNYHTPGFADGNLGTVSFKTPTVWTISGNGVEQEWSDVVLATGCNKETYTAGTTNNWNSECRNNILGHGDLFSWCAVKRFAEQLCPVPWHAPTNQDFCDLDKALGGPQPCTVGYKSYTNTAIYNKYMGTSGTTGQFWGAANSRICDSNGTVMHCSVTQACVAYWTQSQYSANNPYYVCLNSPNFVYPQSYHASNAGLGLLLRCVK